MICRIIGLVSPLDFFGLNLKRGYRLIKERARRMKKNESRKLITLLEKLTGEKASKDGGLILKKIILPFENNNKFKKSGGSGIGCSQFNELLILLGFDRISDSFFQYYFVDKKVEYQMGACIQNWEQLEKGVERFRIHAIVKYGNIKYAFKYRSQLPSDDLDNEVSYHKHTPDEFFTKRHKPLLELQSIKAEDTYYLGYIIGDEIKRRLKENPNDSKAKAEDRKRLSTIKKGKSNQEAYLTSDHLDVYVATSMRERHEYAFVNKVTKDIFLHSALKDLSIVYFDPTLAYCTDRIDKGLSEGLMLKRACCTLYLAQESDTLGKDSELASTLAQGKPVIAYLPELEDETEYVNNYLSSLRSLYPEKTNNEILVEQLELFAPELAWKQKKIRKWADKPEDIPTNDAQKMLASHMKKHYDKRAKTLKEVHPLGIQVNLETGVANGVLVTITIEQCAEIISKILKNRLEFTIKEEKIDGKVYLKLIERISGCVFRVVTGDEFLTNSFWNFYLKM